MSFAPIPSSYSRDVKTYYYKGLVIHVPILFSTVSDGIVQNQKDNIDRLQLHRKNRVSQLQKVEVIGWSSTWSAVFLLLPPGWKEHHLLSDAHPVCWTKKQEVDLAGVFLIKAVNCLLIAQDSSKIPLSWLKNYDDMLQRFESTRHAKSLEISTPTPSPVGPKSTPSEHSSNEIYTTCAKIATEVPGTTTINLSPKGLPDNAIHHLEWTQHVEINSQDVHSSVIYQYYGVSSMFHGNSSSIEPAVQPNPSQTISSSLTLPEKNTASSARGTAKQGHEKSAAYVIDSRKPTHPLCSDGHFSDDLKNPSPNGALPTATLNIATGPVPSISASTERSSLPKLFYGLTYAPHKRPVSAIADGPKASESSTMHQNTLLQTDSAAWCNNHIWEFCNNSSENSIADELLHTAPAPLANWSPEINDHKFITSTVPPWMDTSTSPSSHDIKCPSATIMAPKLQYSQITAEAGCHNLEEKSMRCSVLQMFSQHGRQPLEDEARNLIKDLGPSAKTGCYRYHDMYPDMALVNGWASPSWWPPDARYAHVKNLKISELVSIVAKLRKQFNSIASIYQDFLSSSIALLCYALRNCRLENFEKVVSRWRKDDIRRFIKTWISILEPDKLDAIYGGRQLDTGPLPQWWPEAVDYEPIYKVYKEYFPRICLNLLQFYPSIVAEVTTFTKPWTDQLTEFFNFLQSEELLFSAEDTFDASKSKYII
ncbi:hypothetical protein IQ07DRAFT_637624 [Pyrenochaeta sp. DS3sAY3a]|nr:hypothetical protein IQ07DRAFT_637624 [Pyrenochaeta sp. DS3sAY3a]